MLSALSLLLAYLLGSIPFGLLVVRVLDGTDVREHGSGNIGATNVLRKAGTAAGIVTLLLDAAKGFAAVWFADWATGGSVLFMSAAALLVLLGHAFPVWLQFKGGKAVAAFIGAFAYLTPLALLAVVLIFVAIVATTRYLSLGSIVAAGLFPLACWMILHPAWPVLAAALGAAVLIVDRHRANVARIRDGSERVFRFQRSAP